MERKLGKTHGPDVLVINDEFVKRYDSWIMDIIGKMGIVGEAREDIKVKVYERMINHNNYDKEKSGITNWIRMVVRSVTSNEVKKKSRSQDIWDRSEQSDNLHSLMGAEDAGTDADEVDRLIGVLNLSPRDHGILDMVWHQGYTHKDVAITLDMKEDTVRQIVYRSLQRIKEHVAAEEAAIAAM